MVRINSGAGANCQLTGGWHLASNIYGMPGISLAFLCLLDFSGHVNCLNPLKELIKMI